ncbi:hypothetical protein [Paenibacillus odorifer]|uniref:hypothetical protein n=1 Tax=Paenibacillus odorifer TaxID=189426 RepID=UPI00096FD6FB|nr:hypothetical protein [Paenibacillus odorifer]OMD16244.1 hypothetical protein BJP50_18580 [Paenibacillus odorifer]
MNPILLNDWKSVEDMYEDFEEDWGISHNHPITDKDDIEIILASYTNENYEGEAFVLFRRKSDGKLYEVNGGHCSCYGLEGQWNPEETTVEALEYRLVSGTLGKSGWDDDVNRFADELTEALHGLTESTTLKEAA